MADTGDDPTARAILSVVLLFMEASVPKHFQPWLGGGRLVGIGKDDAPLDVDARPLVVGEVWRRIAGKLCLAGDREGLAGWLRPHQLAVGTPAGVEAIVHALRQWWDRNKAAGNTKAVLVKEDYSNAFNTAEPEAFLASGRRKMPGSARLANWCYGTPTNLIYDGKTYKSFRGQQGCPLMMPLYCAMRRDMRDRIPDLNQVDFVADFADDGVLGGDCDKVLAVLKREIELGPEYGSKFNFSKMVVYPVAGQLFDGDLEGYRQLGIKVDLSGNVVFMKVPIAGSAAFCKEWGRLKMVEIRKVFDGLRGLPSRHVSMFLLRVAGNVCKVVYILRVVPRDMIEDFIIDFDSALKETFEEIVGLRLDALQWAQSCFRISEGGMGMRMAGQSADPAYISSRARSLEYCQGLDPAHVWDPGLVDVSGVGSGVGASAWAIGRYNGEWPESKRYYSFESETLKSQMLLTLLVDRVRRDTFESQLGGQRARFLRAAAPHAGD